MGSALQLDLFGVVDPVPVITPKLIHPAPKQVEPKTDQLRQITPKVTRPFARGQVVRIAGTEYQVSTSTMLPDGRAEVSLHIEPGTWWPVRLTRDGDGWRHHTGPVSIDSAQPTKGTALASLRHAAVEMRNLHSKRLTILRASGEDESDALARFGRWQRILFDADTARCEADAIAILRAALEVANV